MIGRIAGVLLLGGLLALGIGAADRVAPATQPTQTAKSDPSPAELIEKLRARRAVEAHKTKVGVIELDTPVEEKSPQFSIFGNDDFLTIRNLINRLHDARDDHDLKAVVLIFSTTQFNLAQAQEIRTALDDIRRAGKRTFVYSDAYDTDSYMAACGATDICLLAGGEMELPGVGIQTMFAKDLLEKVGVQADYVQIGEYKGADEEMTRNNASDELKGELNKIVDSLYTQIVGDIASHRNLPPEAVRAAIEDALLSAKSAKERGLVDHLVDRDSMGDLVKKELGNDLNVVKNYGMSERQKIDLSNPWAFLAILTKRTPESDSPAVAVIHAEGVIVDGSAEDGIFGSGGNIGGEDIRKAFRAAANDENVKAIVLRIDSPGGSALASEVMWQAARHAAEKKPLIVSVGAMAASGGYYLASSGDYIFADPAAIVGSIGVVGGKFVTRDLFKMVGLHTETFSRGQNADMFSSDHPFTDRQRKMVTQWMHDTYDQFTQRVMSHRRGKIKDIDQVARGRIFIAREARYLGMVDELGGIDDAINFAAAQVGLKSGSYDVKDFPPTRTLGDILSGNAGDADEIMPFHPSVKVELSADSLLRLASPSVRRVMGRELQYIQMLQSRPLLLAAPYEVTIK